MPKPSTVHFVVPDGVDDLSRPSGGNAYDLALERYLPDAGWRVHRYPVVGAWPNPDQEARRALARHLASLPDGSTTLLDGLVACGVPEILEAEAERLRQVVLVHLPLALEGGLSPGVAAARDGGERRALRCASSVIATSQPAASHLVTHHNLPPDTVHAAVPGVSLPPMTEPGGEPGRLSLSITSITPTPNALVVPLRPQGIHA